MPISDASLRHAMRDDRSWQRGHTERLLDRQHGGRQDWYLLHGACGPRSEFTRIRKFGERAFRLDPTGLDTDVWLEGFVMEYD